MPIPEKYMVIKIMILASASGLIFGLLKGMPPEGKFVQTMKNIMVITAFIFGLIFLKDYYG